MTSKFHLILQVAAIDGKHIVQTPIFHSYVVLVTQHASVSFLAN
jgi:hypothetical protein